MGESTPQADYVAQRLASTAKPGRSPQRGKPAPLGPIRHITWPGMDGQVINVDF